MAVLEELRYKEQSNLPSVEILTSSLELGGRMSELDRRKITEDEERIQSILDSPDNRTFIRSLYSEMVKRRVGIPSESIEFPNNLSIKDRKDAHYEKIEDSGIVAHYSFRGDHIYIIQPSLMFGFDDSNLARCLRIKAKRTIHVGGQPLTRSVNFYGTDNQGDLGIEINDETRIIELSPVEGNVSALVTDSTRLVASEGAGKMFLAILGLTKPSANEDIKKWGLLITGDRGEIFKGYVDLSEFKKKIIVEDTVLTDKGIRELILRNLPRMLPLEKSTGTVYRMESPNSNTAVAETSVSFNTLLPRF